MSQGGHCNLEGREYDSSALGCWQMCPRKFYYTYVLGLSPSQPSYAMEFGTFMHDSLSARTQLGMKEALEVWDKWPYPESEKFTAPRGMSLIKEFDNHYKGEEREVLANESAFKLAMPEGSFLTGRLDLIVKQQGMAYVLDYKTKSRVGANFIDEFRPNLQMTCYCHACREFIGDCQGAIVSVINTSDSGKIRFEEQVTSRSKYELDLFVFDTFPKLVQDIERAIRTKSFPLFEANCYKYYVMCQYDKLCKLGCTESVMGMFYKREETEENEDN